MNRWNPFSASSLSTTSTSSSIPAVDQTFRIPTRKGKVSLNIASFNIRFSNEARPSTSSTDSTSGVGSIESIGSFSAASPYLMRQYWGERSWFLRGPKISDLALVHDWDVFGFQEVLHGQLQNLIGWLGPEYDYAGVGRDDGAKKGEAVPLFWRKDTLVKVNKHQGGIGNDGVEHFWLSSTPEVVGSVGWDAALTRMCTHVSLKLRATDEIIHVFSTHYDHQGVVARSQSSRLILERSRKASEDTKQFLLRAQQRSRTDTGQHEPGNTSDTSDYPSDSNIAEPLVILIGDLNSPRNEASWLNLVPGQYGVPSNPSWMDVTTASNEQNNASFLDTALSVPTLLRSPYLTDNEDPKRSELASGRTKPSFPPSSGMGGMMFEPVGPLRTFTDFEPSNRKAIEDRIDFIMLLNNHAVKDQTRSDTVLDHRSSPPPSPPSASARSASEQVSLSAAKQEDKIKDADGRWTIRTFATLPNWSESDAGFLISDHRPIMTRIQKTSPSSPK